MIKHEDTRDDIFDEYKKGTIRRRVNQQEFTSNTFDNISLPGWETNTGKTLKKKPANRGIKLPPQQVTMVVVKEMPPLTAKQQFIVKPPRIIKVNSVPIIQHPMEQKLPVEQPVIKKNTIYKSLIIAAISAACGISLLNILYQLDLSGVIDKLLKNSIFTAAINAIIIGLGSFVFAFAGSLIYDKISDSKLSLTEAFINAGIVFVLNGLIDITHKMVIPEIAEKFQLLFTIGMSVGMMGIDIIAVCAVNSIRENSK